ncbi:helix-turn-helix domain-containing protein [Candidatus Regiella insecticola]|nr:helix-turn-helix transcriptional regulator [Candidatus Regiella insecticola]
MKKVFRIHDIASYHKLFSKLSTKEIQVLALSCSGLDRNAIARELNICIGTVNRHLNNAMNKYERESYAELRALFYFKINEKLIKFIP